MYKQQPVCVDDYGDAVYIGHYTGALVFCRDAAFFGPLLPQAQCRYIDHAKDGVSARRKSYRAFCDSEANCNTCKWLKRIPHPKHPHYPMKGICTSQHPDFTAHPYNMKEDRITTFHPDDHMGMPCYESRWASD